MKRESALPRSDFLRDGVWTLLFNLLTKSQAVSLVLAGLICGGVTDVGRLSAGAAAAYVGSGLADFGFAPEAGRLIAASPCREAVLLTTRRLLPRGILGAVLAVLIYFAAIGRHLATGTIFFAAIAVMGAALSVSSIDLQTLNALGYFRRTSLSIGLIRVASSVSVLGVAAITRNANIVFVLIAVTESISACTLMIMRARASRGLPWRGRELAVGRGYLWLGLGSTISIFTNTSDVLLVGAVASPLILGIYSIASQMQNAVGTLALSPSVPLPIHIARAVRRREDLTSLLSDSIRATVKVGIVGALLALLALTAYLATPFDSPGIARPSSVTAIILCVSSATAAALAGVYLSTAIGLRRQKLVGLSRVANAVLTIPAFFILTGLFGVLGAAFAATTRDFTMLLLSRYKVLRTLPRTSTTAFCTDRSTRLPEAADLESAGAQRLENGWHNQASPSVLLEKINDPRPLLWEGGPVGLATLPAWGLGLSSGRDRFGDRTSPANDPFPFLAHRPGASKELSRRPTSLPRLTESSALNQSTRGRGLLAGVLLVLGLFMVLKFPLTDRSPTVQLEQYVLIAYSAVRAVRCVRRDAPKIFQLGLWLFTYTLFGLVQTVQLSRYDNPLHVPAPDSVIALQLAVILVGCFAFDFGANVVIFRKASRERGSVKSGRDLSLRRVVILSWINIVLSPFLVANLGGLGALFSSRLAVSEAVGGGVTSQVITSQVPTSKIVLVAFSIACPFLCLFSLIRLRQAEVFRFNQRPDLFLLLVILILLNCIFNNPISQPRYWIATIIISVAVAGRRVGRVGFQMLFVLLFVSTTLVVFPYLDVFRKQEVGSASLQIQSATSIYLNKTDYGSAQDISNAVTYVDQNGATDGRQLLGAALFFVPRSVWSEKPTDTAPLLAAHIGFVRNFNLDAPLWAEGYINFEFPGVIIVLGVFGAIAGWCDRRYRADYNPLNISSVLVPVFVGYQLLILRGSLLQSMGPLAMVLALGFVISVRSRGVTKTLVVDAVAARPSTPPTARDLAPSPFESRCRRLADRRS